MKEISAELAAAIKEVQDFTALVVEMRAEEKRLGAIYNKIKYPDPFEAADAQVFLEQSRRAYQASKNYLGTDRYTRFCKAEEELNLKIDAATKLFLAEFGIQWPKRD